MGEVTLHISVATLRGQKAVNAAHCHMLILLLFSVESHTCQL